MSPRMVLLFEFHFETEFFEFKFEFNCLNQLFKKKPFPLFSAQPKPSLLFSPAAQPKPAQNFPNPAQSAPPLPHRPTGGPRPSGPSSSSGSSGTPAQGVPAMHAPPLLAVIRTPTRRGPGPIYSAAWTPLDPSVEVAATAFA